MDYQVSARKFRPGAFEELIGQGHVVQTLRNAILRKQVAHAYLFSGMRGVGKTTAARILAKALNCETGPTAEPCGQCGSCLEITHGNSVDVIEIDGASNTGVDDVRELRENVKFSPFRGTYRIYIIDEVHMLSNSAFNALLKTLEEPPPHAVFVFATTEAHKIPATITSRCQHFTFRRIPRLEIIARLQVVTQQLDVTIGERSLGAIAKASEGSLRDALSLLDQAVAFGGTTIADHDVDDMLGAVPDELVGRLVDTVVKQNPAAAVELVGEAMVHGYDLRAYCGAVVERMRHLMIAAVVPGLEQAQGLMDLPVEEVEQLLAEANSFSVEQLQDVFQLFSQTEDRLRGTSRPRFIFEVAAVRAARLFQPGVKGAPSAAAPAGSQPRVSTTPVEKGAPAGGASRVPSSPPARRDGPPGPPSAGRPGPQAAASPPVQGAPLRPKNVAGAPPPARPDVKAKPIPAASATQGQPSTERSPAPASGQALRREDWGRVVEAMVERHPNIGTFLEMGALVKIEDSQVIVGFAKAASVACSRIQKEENRALIAKVCREVTGATIRLRVVELTEAQGEDRVTIKQMRTKQREQDDEALLEEVRANPMVKQAMDLFGGKVVKASRVIDKKEG